MKVTKALLCIVCVVIFCSGMYPLAAGTDELLQRAEDYKKRGRYLEALSFYRDMYMNAWSDKLSCLLYKGLGDIYGTYLGDPEQALAYYGRFLEKFPGEARSPEVFHRIAGIHFKAGNRAKAVAWYQKILSLFPQYYYDNHVEKELKDLDDGGMLLDDVTLSVDRPLPLYVRVLIVEETGPIEISSEASMGIFAPESSFFHKVDKKRTARFALKDNRIMFKGYGSLQGAVRIKANDGRHISVNGKEYRGFLWLHVHNNALLVINHVGLDAYLYGVLPREVSHSWPEQALKAQAICARTYALYHMIKREQEMYDVFSTTTSQVYGGKDVEKRETKRAIDATKGRILTYDRKIALTLYHANSGGATETMDGVWGGALPYLTIVEDRFSEGQPGYSWELTLSRKQIYKRLKAYGLPVVSLRDITPDERAPTGRIKTLRVVQDGDSFVLTGNSFRLMLGPGQLKSANFDVTRTKDTFIFHGKGYGHGVGMSQWGAHGMARSGYSFEDILRFYYPGTTIDRIQSL